MADPMLVQYEETQHHVATIRELDEALDQVSADAARHDRPIYVHLVNASHTCALDIGLGQPAYSSLTLHTLTERAVEFSVGTVDAPEEAEFYLGGTPTVIEPGTAVSVTEARTAAREFFQTGQRPSSVTWFVPE